MKSLLVHKLGSLGELDTYSDIQSTLQELPWHSIDQCNWSGEFPYAPQCKFQIAYTDTQIVLHYHIIEEYVRASYMRHNDDIWKDSCVEFFISLDNRKTYYNFEFNLLGSGIIGYGSTQKDERARLNSEIIDQVRTFSTIRGRDRVKEWNIILVIPIEILQLKKISGKKYQANFYKCGDELPRPHFLSWNAITTDSPNFHLPNFFGEIEFE